MTSTVARVPAPLSVNPIVIRTALTLSIAALLVLMPEWAFAQDLQGKADTALKWIKQGVHTILIVAVIGSGVLAAFGRMSWSTVGQVLVGSIVAGVATEVVDALYGGGG